MNIAPDYEAIQMLTSFKTFTPASTTCNANPCQNGGTCTPSGSNYFCSCRSGYTGVNCQIFSPQACNPSPCQNGGICNVLGSGYSCTCPAGYTGVNCQIFSSQACNPSPCQNGGICNILGSGYSCTCSSGYTGVNCQIFSTQACNPSPCQNGGLCSALGSGYSCTCFNGYTGVNCQILPQQVCNSNPCQNGGLCNPFGSSYSCTCSQFFTGANCQAINDGPIQITNCFNGASDTGASVNSPVTVTWQMPSATSSGVQLTPISNFGGATSTSLFPGQAILVQYTFTDSFGNQATCAFPISASAASGPQVNDCPTNIERVVPQNQASIRVSWQEPSSLGPLRSQSRQSGEMFFVGNNPVYYVFGDPSINPSVCAFVVTVKQNALAVGRKKKDAQHLPNMDICEESPCGHANGSFCITCVRGFGEIYGYACLPHHHNGSLAIMTECNAIPYDQFDNDIEYTDEPGNMGIPITSVNRLHHRLSPVAITALVVAICIAILLLFIGVLIIAHVFRNSKEFQQQMFEYQAKIDAKKMPIVY